MTKKELSRLICPYCNSKFHLNHVVTKKNHVIEYATVYCNCDEFPIVSGILYLNKSKIKSIVSSLQQKHSFNALCSAFEFGRFKSLLMAIFIQINKHHLSPNNFLNIFLIKHLWNIGHSELNYYLNRRIEIESLLFFTPLSFRKINSHSIWLDVGSGITNYYRELHFIHPDITIISLEKMFRNIFLSRLFHPEKNVTYICSDFCKGQVLPQNSADIITIIDSFPFIEQQKYTLDTISQNTLKKGGIFFVTGIVEHIYFSDYNHIFPISTRLARNYLPSAGQLFDEIKLCQNLNKRNPFTKSLIKLSSSPQFRYCLLWPTKKLPPTFFLPPSIPTTNLTLWQNPEIKWRNQVY
jgi:hypothetical protein